MKKNIHIVLLVLTTFFVISFISNILGPIFPALITSFDIGIGLAGFFPFAFFAAYGVMSIPAGLFVQRYGEKMAMVSAFLLAMLGSLLFAFLPIFIVAMGFLFLIGTAMAILQVAINPLLRVSGGKQHFAVFSVAAQLLFGAAATISPLIYSGIEADIQNGSGFGSLFLGLVPDSMNWVAMYWLFAAICIVMLIAVALLKIENVEREEKEQVIGFAQSLSLFKSKTVILFFFSIVSYVALEQGVANSISLFLSQYHDVDPMTQGAQIVSRFWLCLTLGCVLGLVLLKLLDAKLVILLFTSGAAISLVFALFGDLKVALVAFPAIGFFMSIMWSVLFSLALNSVSKGHGAFSGVLCTGIVGGAIASPIIGFVAQAINSLQVAMLLLFIPLGFIFSVGIWANPLVKNHRIQIVKRKAV